MTSQELTSAIEKSIVNKQTLPDIRAILVNYQNQGGTQITAQGILSNLAKKYESNELDSEDVHDSIYEILDFVCGWCSSDFEIW